MSKGDSINRRTFFEKSSLIAVAATAAAGVKEAAAQINNASGPPPKTVRLGFVGVGIRGNLLMEAAAGITGV